MDTDRHRGKVILVTGGASGSKTPEAVVEGFAASIPWRRFGTPEGVAMAASWLASAEAEFINGQTIGINGAELPS